MVSHRKPAKPAFDPRTVKENIVETPLNEEMSKSFLEYAYSVIYARALPDARDGLEAGATPHHLSDGPDESQS